MNYAFSGDYCTPAEDLRAWRERTRAVVERLERWDDEGPIEIDVEDMIGAKGKKLPAPEGWPGSVDIESGYSANSLAVSLGMRDPAYEEQARFAEETEFPDPQTIAPLLGKLAARIAEEAQDPLREAVKRLREPIRTVAINCLYFDAGAEETARRMGTSIETVEFLSEVALDMLATHLRFK